MSQIPTEKLKLSKPFGVLACALLLSVSVYGLGYEVAQDTFSRIALFFSMGFLGYLMVLSFPELLKYWRLWVGLGISLRLLLLFGMPTLSDDVFRFLWDGHLLRSGINPFSELPGFYLEQGQEVPGLSRDLFFALNSPDYFTIYPPFAQATFVAAVWFFPQSILGASLVLKLVLLFCELGNLWLIPKILKQLQLPKSNVVIYALNPLIIVEVVGNLHYEGAMIFFLLLSWFLFFKQKDSWSAIAFSFSIAAKLLTVLFLPFYWSRRPRKRVLLYYALIIIGTLLLFVPLLSNGFLDGFGSSVSLYFKKFEFNASLYYLIRWVGFQFVGYNIIQSVGPVLGFLVVLVIGVAGLLDTSKAYPSLPYRMLGAICLYLAFATTVHPWYVSLPLVLCLFTHWRFPVIWSALIWLTYWNYDTAIYQERLWVVALEYGVVFVWAYLEYRHQKLKPGSVLHFAKPLH